MNIALLADLHLGIKKQCPVFMESQLRFFREQFVPELIEQGIKTIWVLGDVFDTRQQINTLVINKAIELFRDTLKDFDVRILVGNHDMYLTTDTAINSLKILDLLPNVIVYEKPTDVIIDNKRVLVLPWVTDYTKVNDIITDNYDYCFCHADIIGFDMGGRLSETGFTAQTLLNKINHVYSGHYHNGVNKTYLNDKSITYVGSPYQLTRIDRNTVKGYRILNIETNQQTLIENNISIKFIKHTYPNIDFNLIKNNVVDIDIPYEFADQTKKIYQIIAKIEKLNPAYPPNLNWLQNEQDQAIQDIPDNLNIISLFNSYLEQLDTKLNKNKLNESFIELYNQYKDQS